MTFGHLRKSQAAVTEPETDAGADGQASETTPRKGRATDQAAVRRSDRTSSRSEAQDDGDVAPVTLVSDASLEASAPDGVQTALNELDELSSLQERRLGITGRVPESLKDNLEAFLLANKRRIGRKPSADMMVEAWISLTLHDEEVQRKFLLMLRERVNRG